MWEKIEGLDYYGNEIPERGPLQDDVWIEIKIGRRDIDENGDQTSKEVVKYSESMQVDEFGSGDGVIGVSDLNLLVDHLEDIIDSMNERRGHKVKLPRQRCPECKGLVCWDDEMVVCPPLDK